MALLEGANKHGNLQLHEFILADLTRQVANHLPDMDDAAALMLLHHSEN